MIASPPGSRLSAIIGLAVALGLGVGLRLLEWPAWASLAAQTGGPPILPSFDAYGWLAGAGCVGRLAGQPLSLTLHGLAAALPFSLESIAFCLPVILSSLAAWPLITLLYGLGIPEAAASAALCVVLTPAYVYRTRLGYCDTDLLLVPLAWAAVCTLALWHPGPAAVAASGQPLRFRLDWSWLLPAAFLALLHWIHPGFRLVLAAMGLLFLLSVWPVARTSHRDQTSATAIVLAALAGAWGLLAGLALCFLATVLPASGRRVLPVVLLVALAWMLPDMAERAQQSVLFFLKPQAAFPSLSRTSIQSVATSVLEAQSPPLQETLRQGAFSWGIGLAAALGYIGALVRFPRLLPSLPLAALAALAPMLGIRFAMYGGVITGLGLPLALAMVRRRMGWKAGPRWLLQSLLAALIIVLAWRDAQTFFPVPIISPPHAAALARLGTLAAPDAQVWTWWDYGYAAQFLAQRRSFADPGNNTGMVLHLLSQALAADTPETAATTMTEGALRQPPPPLPSLASRLTCPDGVRNNAPFPDGPLARPSPRPGVALPEQYLVVSWEGLRIARWPLYFATPLSAGELPPPAWPVLAISPKRLNLDAGWVELTEGLFALSQLDVFQPTGRHTHRSWPRGKGLAAVLNLGNGELLLFDAASRQTMQARLLIDQDSGLSEHFELVVDHAPWVRIYRLRPRP